MSTLSATAAGPSPAAGLKKVLLLCGIISSVYYVFLNVYVPAQWQGYSSISQTVSELSAIGAPTRALWLRLCFFYSVLVIAFGWGIFQSARGNNSLRNLAMVITAYGVSGFFWPPMHQRVVLAAGGGTLTDTLHIAFAMLTLALMIAAVMFASAALGKAFRTYSMISLLALIAFGIMTVIESPGIQSNTPTPAIGIWERVNIGIFMIWIIVLAILLLKGTFRQKLIQHDGSSTPSAEHQKGSAASIIL